MPVRETEEQRYNKGAECGIQEKAVRVRRCQSKGYYIDSEPLGVFGQTF